MFKFENQLLKLKHEVLTRIAVLAKDNKVTPEEMKNIAFEMIPGTIPKYRDTVDHERDVVLERAKLAAGYLPNEKSSDELTDISDEEQIMYVIKAACDRCPTKKYEVTDACRNCIAHKCQSTCNFGAISYINGRAHIDPDKCKECGMCKKACPYDAIAYDMRPCKRSCPTGALSINNADLSAELNSDKCINCGACMSACPFGAIEDKSSIVKVVRELVNGSDIYAAVAPAITGQFKMKIGYGQIKNAIKKLGFKDMVEVACGADAVTEHESHELEERIKNGDSYMTNSCCPGFTEYIKKVIPSEKDRISNTISPMIAIGRYIKSKEQGCKVVFIGPCTAKKREIFSPSVKDAIDYVLTFEELLALFDAFDVNIEECDEEDIEDASVYGRGFGMSGGITEAIKNYINDNNIKIDFNPVKVSGGSEIKKAIMLAKAGKASGNFIEGMMCEGGCINGSAKVLSASKAKAAFIKNNNKTKIKNVSDNKALNEYKNIKMDR